MSPRRSRSGGIWMILIHLVGQRTGEHVASAAIGGSDSPDITRHRIVKGVEEVKNPAGVASFRICAEYAREWECKIHRTAASANRALRSDNGYSISQSENDV